MSYLRQRNGGDTRGVCQIAYRKTRGRIHLEAEGKSPHISGSCPTREMQTIDFRLDLNSKREVRVKTLNSEI